MGATSSISESKFNIKLGIKDIPPILLQITNVDSFADSNDQVTVKQLIDCFSSRTDVFLSHNWGEDQRVHKFVSKVNKELQQLGFTTWFDEERMQGDIRDQMTKGIDQSSVVLVFVTKQYMEKVSSDNQNDNCKLEFGYAALKKSSAKMIAVVIEEEMLVSSKWYGDLGMVLGNKLYIPLVKKDAESFDFAISTINTRIRSLVPAVVKEVLESTDWIALINASAVVDEIEEVVGQCIECGEVATQHCSDCGTDYCDACCAIAHRMKAYQKHSRCLMSEKAFQPLGTCALHKEAVTKNMNYCCTCETLLCNQCISVGVHSSHIFKSCNDLKAGSTTMNAIQLEADSLLVELEKHMAKIKEIELDKILNDDSKIRLVREKFTAIRNALDEKEDSIVTEIRASTKESLINVSESLAQSEVLKWNLIQAAYDAGTKAKTVGVQFAVNSTKLLKMTEEQKSVMAMIKLPIVKASVLKYEIDETAMISEINKSHALYDPFDILLLLFGNGLDGNLVVTSRLELEAGRIYQYSSVTIERGGELAVNSWDGSTGGYLRLQVTGKLEIKAGGKIDMNCVGYRGGALNCQGESYTGLGAKKSESNGGGGGGGHDNFYGRGGGYGTVGGGSNGGEVYGDEAITFPEKWMGSGGGSSNVQGGNGGGSVYISAETFENYGEITSCGGVNREAGGSGGSIKILTSMILSIGKLTAIGDSGGNSSYKGGDGRIRIELKKSSSATAPNFKTVTPKPSFVIF